MTESKNKSHEITYEENTIKTLNSLAKINSKLLFTSEKVTEENAEGEEVEVEKLYVKTKNPSSTLVLIFEAPKEHFNFSGDKMAFYDFNEFYDLFDIFKDDKKIIQTTEKLHIKTTKGKLTYHLADEEVISGKVNKVNYSEPDYAFEMSSEQLSEINKLISKLGSTSVKLTYGAEDHTLKIKLFADEVDNSFEYDYDLSFQDEDSEDFTLTIDKEVFTVLPSVDYVVSVKNEGVLEFHHMAGDVDFKVYASEMEEDDD